MKNLRLSTKILAISIFILIVFCFASFGILFRALSNQASREMEQLLKSESLALSSLINSTLKDNFEFEMHSKFLSQYHQRNPNGFFRFFDSRDGKVLKESLGAPAIDCDLSRSHEDILVGGKTYKVEAFQFTPELDAEHEIPPVGKKIGRAVCLVTGIDRAPYLKVRQETLLSSIPILVLIMVLLVVLLLVLIRGLTKDLQSLHKVLTSANFDKTYAFPTLPKANTPEVASIIAVLERLHREADQIYREMWLFMGRAAHQIKTPVTAMQATVEVLLRKERTRDELLTGLADVKSAVGHLIILTKKLMSSSRISFQEPPALEDIELSEFFSEQRELFRSKASERNVLLKIVEGDSLTVRGNRSLMYDVFSNLIENSIQYSVPDRESVIQIAWRRASQVALIEVSDQGPGFPPSILEDLFKPFVRGDERRVQGSGLGLSIAKKSVELMGGQIKLTETSASGSTIQVLLPTLDK